MTLTINRTTRNLYSSIYQRSINQSRQRRIIKKLITLFSLCRKCLKNLSQRGQIYLRRGSMIKIHINHRLIRRVKRLIWSSKTDLRILARLLGKMLSIKTCKLKHKLRALVSNPTHSNLTSVSTSIPSPRSPSTPELTCSQKSRNRETTNFNFFRKSMKTKSLVSAPSDQIY